MPFPSPGNLPDPGIGPESPALAGGFFTTEPPGKTLVALDFIYSVQTIHPDTLLLLLSHFSRVLPFGILWTVARQAPLSMGFPRQEYRSGLPFPPSGDLPNPGTEHASGGSLMLVLALWNN